MIRINNYLIILILVSSFVVAGGVSRSFSSNNVDSGQQLQVTINVVVDPGERYYAIEEHVPSGWIITDWGVGNVASNVITWVKPQNAESVTYAYKVQAPGNARTYQFNGKYGLNSAEVKTISGETNVVVNDFQATGSPPGSPGGGSSGVSGGTPQCRDGVDNDGDGLNDYPNDSGCVSANDDDETNVKECKERWVCDDYSECINQKQTRECYDTNTCGTELKKPNIEKECELESFIDEFSIDELLSDLAYTKNQKSNLIYVALIIGAIVLLVIIEEIIRRKRRGYIKDKYGELYELIELAEKNIDNYNLTYHYYSELKNRFEKNINKYDQKDAETIRKEVYDLYNKIRKKYNLD